MVVGNGTQLTGITEIAQYIRRSDKTTLQLIRYNGLPAQKIGLYWESDKELIDAWRKAQVQAGTQARSVKGNDTTAENNVPEKKRKSRKVTDSREIPW